MIFHYNVGDVVTVRNDLRVGLCGIVGVVSEMKRFAGKPLTICGIRWVRTTPIYTVRENTWNWTNAMLEGYAAEPVSLDISDIL